MLSSIKKAMVLALVAVAATHINADFLPISSTLDEQECTAVCQKAGKKYNGRYVTPESDEKLWVQLSDKYENPDHNFCGCF